MNANTDRETEIFEEAVQREGRERAAYLDGACQGDPDLRRRMDELLAAHEAPGETLNTTILAAGGQPGFTPFEPPDESVGQTLGRYKLLERIGEGGCGVVYVAEQTEPVRRRVALKVIKLGMDTQQVVARFEAERQALAMMDHPNIAKVLDAGTTELGRPYFVMELVRGVRITDFCDQANLSTKDRLELFIKVCQAIQHAHQKGIIHRDIKPSNILVTLHDGVPVPKVIDFGIAKATEGKLTDATVYTQLHQFIGTPAYMSPEQAEMSGLDIDTRSDIYSLGVLLYELLAGSPPFDPRELMSQGIDAMRRTIREKEPQRPSTRLATLGGDQLTTAARRRSADTAKLLHQLQGDLDWIVMKCLEKDRQRRYDTANGLAAEIRRYLDNEPVTARPPSTVYRFQKAFRRNKVAFAAATAVTAALLLGVVVSTWQAVRATRAKQRALEAEAHATEQRDKANASEDKALLAQAGESRLRKQAEASELAARQRAYASDMNVARHALAENNLGRALDLLNRQRPQPGQRDLRGWEWRYLWKQTRSDAVFTLCQEPAGVASLAASPDGHWLAVGSHHPFGLKVWDLRTRQELFRLAKNEAYVRAAFSPVEPILAFTGTSYLVDNQQRFTLRLWNYATQGMVAEVPLDNDCLGLAFAQDGRTLVTSTAQGHITLWQVPTGSKLASFPSEQAGGSLTRGFAAAPDLSVAAYALSGGRIRVMDLRSGNELWTTRAAKEFVTTLAFSPDGKTLASGAGYTESEIRLWEVATGKQFGQLDGHGSWVGSLVFWPDGRKLASSSADQSVRIWDVASHRALDVMRGHRLEVWRLTLLPDGKTLVSGGKDGTVNVWDTSVTHARPSRTTLPATQVVNSTFADDSRSILTLNRAGEVTQWAGADYQLATPLLELGEMILTSCFSEDGRRLAAHWTNGTVQIWDLTQRILRHRFTAAPGMVWSRASGQEAFVPGGQKLVTWSAHNNLMHQWDLTSGVDEQSWQAPLAANSFALSPDGRQCLAFGWEGNFVLRNLFERSQRTLDLDFLEPDMGSYSPDGSLFATASSQGFGKVWNTETWQPVATLGGFLKGAHALAFSADGKRLAISGGDHEAVKLWDTESWQDVFTLEADGTGYMGVWFSPDGNSITWGNQSGVVHFWRAPSWEEIAAAEAKEKAEGRQP
ncbi:MAG: protein kinase [Verrucomicrobiales bacterium]|nr:protein kinase [Verrucomicrobiales bacterium]